MMDDTRPNATWVIVATFVIAYVLSVLPLPPLLEYARPEWVAMVLLYWVLALPHRVGIVLGWCAGLMLDILEGTAMGQHAFSLAVVAFWTYVLHLRIRVFPMWQQCITVLVLVGMHQLICYGIQSTVSQVSNSMVYWIPSLVSALLWPWVMIMLRSIRRHYHVR